MIIFLIDSVLACSHFILQSIITNNCTCSKNLCISQVLMKYFLVIPSTFP